MFPSQTSLIPAAVSLARFMEANGSGGLYPYWYLGTTPFKYLTGPVVPYIMVGLRSIFPGFSFFDLAFFLIFIAFLVRALGWGIFVYRLSGSKQAGWVGGFLTLILPWHIVSALGLGETSAVIAGAMTPWVLLAFAKVESGKWKVESLVIAAISFSFLLLTNTTASVSAILGLLIISFSTLNFQLSILKKVLTVVVLGGLLTLWWYTPGYWLTVWGAPGIGGKNIFGVLSTLADFLRGFLPVIAAMLFVFWKIKPKTAIEKFSLGWVVLFGSLTLFRFMADWDFWMDWTVWMGEVEVGVALLIAGLFTQLISSSVARSSHPTSSASSKSVVNQHSIPGLRALDGTPSARNTRNLSVLVIMFSIYLIGGWGLAIINRAFWLPRADISQTVEFKIANWLQRETVNCQLPALSACPELCRRGVEGSTVNCPTVFLSGTTAFWLNSFVDVKQVRGGRDEGSVDDRWRGVAWVVREGEMAKRSAEALKSIGVDFLAVHTEGSGEYYHDFKNPEKFEETEYFEQEYSDHGDMIYRIK